VKLLSLNIAGILLKSFFGYPDIRTSSTSFIKTRPFVWQSVRGMSGKYQTNLNISRTGRVALM